MKTHKGDDFLEENKEFESLRVVRERNTENYILVAGSAKAKVFSVTILKFGEGQWQSCHWHLKEKISHSSWCYWDEVKLLGSWELKMPVCLPLLSVLHSVSGFPAVFQGGQNFECIYWIYHCYQFFFPVWHHGFRGSPTCASLAIQFW